MGERRRFADRFKAKVAFEAACGDKAIQEIAAKHQVHPNQASKCKRQALMKHPDRLSSSYSMRACCIFLAPISDISSPCAS